MAKVLLTVRIEDSTKQQLKMFAKDMGLSLSGVVGALAKQAVRDKRIFLTGQIRGSYLTPTVLMSAQPAQPRRQLET